MKREISVQASGEAVGQSQAKRMKGFASMNKKDDHEILTHVNTVKTPISSLSSAQSFAWAVSEAFFGRRIENRVKRMPDFKLQKESETDDIIDPLFLLDEVCSNKERHHSSKGNSASKDSLKAIVDTAFAEVIPDEDSDLFALDWNLETTGRSIELGTKYQPAPPVTSNVHLDESFSIDSAIMNPVSHCGAEHLQVASHCGAEHLQVASQFLNFHARHDDHARETLSKHNIEKHLIPPEDSGTCASAAATVSSDILPKSSNINTEELMKLRNSHFPVLITLTSFPFRIIYANDAYSKMTGKSNVIGESFYKVFGRDTFQQAPTMASCSTPLGKEQSRVRLSCCTSLTVPTEIHGRFQVYPVLTSEHGLLYYAAVFEKIQVLRDPRPPPCIFIPLKPKLPAGRNQ